MHIPIKDMNYFYKNMKDCIYLFAWNHKDEILNKEKILKGSGFLMLIYKNRIVFTGGSGRFAQSFKSIEKKTKFNFFFQKK